MIENQEAVETAFRRIGAKVKFEVNDSRRSAARYRVDILDGRRQGDETVLISRKRDWEGDVTVVCADRKRRHLLLMVRTQEGGREEKHRYLIGHDERAWFAAAVVDREFSIRNIEGAVEALKPEAVLIAQEKAKIKSRDLCRRRNRAFTRQGEWFFVPQDTDIADVTVLKNEPLRRGRGKPHIAEMLFRRGKTRVYVCGRYPNGLSEGRFRELLKKEPRLSHLGWRSMVRDPEVYCKGRITHPDHATVTLKGWHRVFPNTESNAPWISSLAFLD